MSALNHLRYTSLASALLVSSGLPAVAGPATTPPTVHLNDNTRAAGTPARYAVAVRLRAAIGTWRPEGDGGPAVTIEALGEEGRALTVPAPLIRVTEGTEIVASVRNELTSPLRVHGLCARDGGACAPLDVPPGADREVRFTSGRAGTYHYWATAIGAPVPFREMGGALIVDPAGAPPVRDRVFVITEWSDLDAGQLRAIMGDDDPSARFVEAKPRVAFMINGLSWPATERLAYDRGETVRWRVINLTSQKHPMHLHGFYFDVLRLGDGRRDEPVNETAGRRVVTQVVPPGGTLEMRWVPERAGNWLFHCHVMFHVAPERRIESPGWQDPDAGHGGHAAHGHDGRDASLGMAGMVLGVTVRERDGDAPAPAAPAGEPRRITLDIDGSSRPTLVLRRGEPTEITLRNRLAEPTSMHWHGLELESFYDGVHGWSGAGSRVAPMIPAGGTFVVRLTPPRAGTFIYHTHLHDYRQLTSGLYGPIVVTEPDETFDPATDHAIVVGRRDATPASSILGDPASVVIDGRRDPRWTWAAKTRHRVRLINITPDDIFSVSLQGTDGPVDWRPLTKDGAPVPPAEATPRPARQTIAVGETYDFEIETPPGRRHLWLEVRGTDGRWQAQGHVLVK